jgi:hypothetical protein
MLMLVLQIIATISFLVMGILNLTPWFKDYNFAGINLSLGILYTFLYFHPFK